MVCLGFKPGVAEWKAQTNPLSYGLMVGRYQWLFSLKIAYITTLDLQFSMVTFLKIGCWLKQNRGPPRFWILLRFDFDKIWAKNSSMLKPNYARWDSFTMGGDFPKKPNLNLPTLRQSSSCHSCRTAFVQYINIRNKAL